MTWKAAIVTALVAGCGPSAGEIRFIKAQAYHAEMDDLTQVAIAAAAPAYQLRVLDKPECPAEVWQECVWQLAAQAPEATEPAMVVEIHRTNDHQVMIEVDPKTVDQKQADALAYRIYDLGKKYIPPPPKYIAPLPHSR
jgi:hypothetical protein